MQIDTVKECIDYLEEIGELNNIKADAIEEAIIETESEYEHGFCCLSQDLLDYANQLREQSK